MSDNSQTTIGETIIQRRIRSRIKELGTNPKAVATRAGLGSTAIRDILDGRSKSPRENTLRKIAKALNCDTAYLTGESDAIGGAGSTNIRTAPVFGEVRAGIWTEIDEFAEITDLQELEQIPCVPDPDYPSHR
ncbi:MAG: helix-turn-helix transcriptional regulator, partial [Roseibium sp.]|nr:helix-turn-helix transcriptional regulator [Roseibium sp.]